MNKLPSISIITVVYNRRKEIEITFQNVLVQEYPFIEYIVIDGGSTDGTKEYLLQHVKQISHFVSEPDKGIYDAMNKGLNKANSDYVLFLNAGDVSATLSIKDFDTDGYIIESNSASSSFVRDSISITVNRS